VKLIIPIFFLSVIFQNVFSQANFGNRIPIEKDLVKNFGAKPDDIKDDSWSLVKASKFALNEWDEQGNMLAEGAINIDYNKYYFILNIPAGVYDVCKQINLHNGLIDSVNYDFNINTKQIEYKFLPKIKFKSNAVFGSEVPQKNNDGIEVVMAINCNSSYYQTKYMIDIPLFYIDNLYRPKNIDGIYIKGEVKNHKYPIFLYSTNLYTGNIDNKGDAVNGCETNMNLYTTTPNMFTFLNVKNAKIENIEVNGRNEMVTYLGPVTDGFQGGHSGAFFRNSKNITIQNCNFHNMGTDGLMIGDNLKENPAPTNIYINNFKGTYNRRQGFSWIGGKGIKVYNSEFSHNGRAISKVQPGREIFSQPCSGLDIECETGAGCFNALFNNCIFANNRSNGIVNDAVDEKQASLTNNISFTNCQIYSHDGWAMWIKGEKFSFTNCGIYGTVIHCPFGVKPNTELRFKDCNFEDKPTIVNGKKLNWTNDRHLFQCDDGAVKIVFSKCNFTVNDNNREIMYLVNSVIPTEQFNQFHNCSFIFNNKGRMRFVNAVDNNYFFNCIFTGNTSFVNKFKSDTNFHLVIVERAFIATNNSNSNFKLLGNIMQDFWSGKQNFLSIGRAFNESNNYTKLNAKSAFTCNYIIGQNAMTHLYRENLYEWINNTKITIQKNGTLSFPFTSISGNPNFEIAEEVNLCGNNSIGFRKQNQSIKAIKDITVVNLWKKYLTVCE
jgi:hypothetical protein